MVMQEPKGFSLSYRRYGLCGGRYTAWTLPSGAELMRAYNQPVGSARGRHEMALALHLCLARGPGRITRHIGEVRELPPPRVGLMTLSPGATDLDYEALGSTEIVTLTLPEAVFAAVGGRADDAFSRGLLPFREDGLRAVLLELLERAACGAAERLYVDHAQAFLAAALASPKRQPGRRPLSDLALRRVLDAIETGLVEAPAEPPSLQALAELAGLSVAEFARCFRAATGETPHAFLTRRRIEQAQAMLRSQPSLPLADLAVALGFADQAHFSRRFRQVTGTTPARFRRGA